MHGFLTGDKAERGGGRWKGDYREEITKDLKDNLKVKELCSPSFALANSQIFFLNYVVISFLT